MCKFLDFSIASTAQRGGPGKITQFVWMVAVCSESSRQVFKFTLFLQPVQAEDKGWLGSGEKRVAEGAKMAQKATAAGPLTNDNECV